MSWVTRKETEKDDIICFSDSFIHCLELWKLLLNYQIKTYSLSGHPIFNQDGTLRKKEQFF